MMSNTEKKKWSKKKKVTVIVLSIFLFFLVAIVVGGIVALDWYCKVPEYNIVFVGQQYEGKDIKLVAHRGFRATAPENTLPAYENANDADFWGAECDIYRTVDGVWVLHHDPITYRMMGEIANIEKLTFDEVMEFTYTNGNELASYPNLKITTLDEYLAECAEGGMNAVIEFKGKNNLEHYDEVVEAIGKYDVDVTVISFQEESLRAFRALSDVPMFYLSTIIDDDAIAVAKELGNCGIDFDGRQKKNLESGFIQKCLDEGLLLNAYTINDPELMKQLVDEGVTYITTDCITY